MGSLGGRSGALRHANFRWFWIAGTVNLTGSMMAGVALSFAVLSISDSPSALGVVLAAETLPLVGFLLFGGVIADRLPLTVVLRAGMVVLAVVNGLASAITFPAMQSILPRLVPPELLQQANALQSFSRGALRVVGPTLSALLVVGVGPGWAVAFDAATWLVAAVILAKVRLPPRPPREDRASTVTELREGFGYVRSTTWLWVVVSSFAVLNAIHTGAWFTLGPPRAKETFGAAGWGLVLSAESVGLIVTTVVMLRRPLRRPLLSGMLGVACLAAPITVLGLYPHVGVLMACTFVAGAGMEVFNMGWSLAMQEQVPEAMLSRAYSYDALGSFVAMPVGQLVYGPLGATFGYREVLVVSGIAYALICLVTLSSASVRNLRRASADALVAAG